MKLNREMKSYRYALLLLAFWVGCSPSEEATTVTRPLHVDGAGITAVQSDLGYTITLTAARAVITNVQFIRAQDVVARGPLSGPPMSWLVGTAHAHPGHGDGGTVVGELPGEHVVDWLGQTDAAIGEAMLIGEANGLTFAFASPTSVQIAGVASKDGVDHPFAADFDLRNIAVEGVPFLLDALNAEAWGLQLTTADPFEGDTLFDGIDFATATWSVGDEGHNRLGRALRTHDHYVVSGVAQ